MTREDQDIHETHLVALVAAILLQPHLTSIDGIDVGWRRRNRLASVVATAEDIVAIVWHRQSESRIEDKVVQLADEHLDSEAAREAATAAKQKQNLMAALPCGTFKN